MGHPSLGRWVGPHQLMGICRRIAVVTREPPWSLEPRVLSTEVHTRGCSTFAWCRFPVIGAILSIVSTAAGIPRQRSVEDAAEERGEVKDHAVLCDTARDPMDRLPCLSCLLLSTPRTPDLHHLARALPAPQDLSSARSPTSHPWSGYVPLSPQPKLPPTSSASHMPHRVWPAALQRRSDEAPTSQVGHTSAVRHVRVASRRVGRGSPTPRLVERPVGWAGR
jgi:hypothetical protein